jgi:hypothetical protein
MLRGRNSSPSDSSAGPSEPTTQAPDHEYDIKAHEADTPTSHYSSKLHADDVTQPSRPHSPSNPGQSRFSSRNTSFDMDREWVDKGYAHEYEESSVGGTTPKLGMSGEKGLSRRALSQGSGLGPGLGIWGKGKKKRLGKLQR